MLAFLLATRLLAAEIVATDDLMGSFFKLQKAAAQPVLVVAVGARAEAAARAAVPAGLSARVVAVALPGEAAGALAASGLRCGVVVSAGKREGWSVETVGDCQPPVAAPVAATPALLPSPEPAPLVASPPPTAAPAVDPLIDTLVALPTHTERKARLATELASADADGAARLGAALAVVGHLERTGRSDRTVVRLFLAAALSPDAAVRASAVEAAQRANDPPMPTYAAAPTPAQPPGPTPAQPLGPVPAPATGSFPTEFARTEALRRYADGRLLRTGPDDGWRVTTGTGRGWSAIDFAQRTGDTTTSRRIADKRRRGKTAMLVMIATGATTAVAGMGIFAAGTSDYDEALMIPGSVMLIGGVGVATSSIAPHLSAKLGTLIPRQVYTPAAAQRWIDTYNDKLRSDLGLTAADVAGLPMR